MRPADLQEREVTLASGGMLRYRTWGSGRPVLIATGLGGGAAAFRGLTARLPGYRFLQWDYRGLSGVGRPVDPAEHARDAVSLLDAENVSEVAVLGWSMGVQVALELFALAHERVRALALIGGGARAAWGDRSEATFPGRLVPRGLSIAHGIPRPLLALCERFLHSPEAHAWALRLGLMGDQVSADDFAELVADFDAVDFDAHLETLALSALHDASALLPRVDVPTLAIAAGRDPFTSRAAVERIVVGVAGAEYLVLPNATHFAPLDQADHIALRIQKFFSERGYGAHESSSSSPASESASAG